MFKNRLDAQRRERSLARFVDYPASREHFYGLPN